MELTFLADCDGLRTDDAAGRCRGEIYPSHNIYLLTENHR